MGSLALFIQEVEQSRRLLADEIDAVRIVNVLDSSPADALRPVVLLQGTQTARSPLNKTVLKKTSK